MIDCDGHKSQVCCVQLPLTRAMSPDRAGRADSRREQRDSQRSGVVKRRCLGLMGRPGQGRVGQGGMGQGRGKRSNTNNSRQGIIVHEHSQLSQSK